MKHQPTVCIHSIQEMLNNTINNNNIVFFYSLTFILFSPFRLFRAHFQMIKALQVLRIHLLELEKVRNARLWHEISVKNQRINLISFISAHLMEKFRFKSYAETFVRDT